MGSNRRRLDETYLTYKFDIMVYLYPDEAAPPRKRRKSPTARNIVGNETPDEGINDNIMEIDVQPAVSGDFNMAEGNYFPVYALQCPEYTNNCGRPWSAI